MGRSCRKNSTLSVVSIIVARMMPTAVPANSRDNIVCAPNITAYATFLEIRFTRRPTKC